MSRSAQAALSFDRREPLIDLDDVTRGKRRDQAGEELVSEHGRRRRRAGERHWPSDDDELDGLFIDGSTNGAHEIVIHAERVAGKGHGACGVADGHAATPRTRIEP